MVFVRDLVRYSSIVEFLKLSNGRGVSILATWWMGDNWIVLKMLLQLLVCAHWRFWYVFTMVALVAIRVIIIIIWRGRCEILTRVEAPCTLRRVMVFYTKLVLEYALNHWSLLLLLKPHLLWQESARCHWSSLSVLGCSETKLDVSTSLRCPNR